MLKYQHVERLNSDEVDGLLIGTVYIQPKIDGANGQIGLDEADSLYCASRNNVLSQENQNMGFWTYVQNHKERYVAYLAEWPWHILYGEWLVPHSLKTYRADAWRRFYVFDVWDIKAGRYLPFDEYQSALERFGIDYVPVISAITNATNESLLRYLESNTFLIQDGMGCGEGIVIKNYGFTNKYGRATWAKIVRNEFKEENRKAFGYPETELTSVELKIAQRYVTPGRLEKVKAKMQETAPWSSRRIPEYLNRVWNEIVTEETWNMIKEFKNPTIDFRALNRLVIARVKEIDSTTF